jgi:hypothetical protein
MARLPDHFDLWVRKARESSDPKRQIDYVLGALATLTNWHFLNIGTKENPQSGEVEIEGGRYLLVFSDQERIAELVEDRLGESTSLPVITIPSSAAMTWCIERKAEGCAGLLVNPGEFAVLVPMKALEVYRDEWNQRDEKFSSGFWIPNMTSEEEDFWQEHGL